MDKLKVLTYNQFVILFFVLFAGFTISVYGFTKALAFFLGVVIGYVIIEVFKKIFVKEEDETEK